jgi:hypothetical protein
MVQDRAQELERQQQETQAAFEAKLRQVEEETTAAAHRAAETHSFQVQVLGSFVCPHARNGRPLLHPLRD